MIHAALLLLMLEAAQRGPRFHHQPEAPHPKSSAIHKLARPITPSFRQIGHSPRHHAMPKSEHRLGGRYSGYSPDTIARSSRKRISPSLLVSEITNRTRPWLEVSA